MHGQINTKFLIFGDIILMIFGAVAVICKETIEREKHTVCDDTPP